MDYLPLWLAAMLGVVALAAGPGLLQYPVLTEFAAPLIRPTLGQPAEAAAPPPAVAVPTEASLAEEPTGAGPVVVLVRAAESLPTATSQPGPAVEHTSEPPAAAAPPAPSTTAPEVSVTSRSVTGAQITEPEKPLDAPAGPLPDRLVRRPESASLALNEPTPIAKPAPGADRSGPDSWPGPGANNGAGTDKDARPGKGSDDHRGKPSDDRPGKENHGGSSGKGKPDKEPAGGKHGKSDPHGKPGKNR